MRFEYKRVHHQICTVREEIGQLLEVERSGELQRQARKREASREGIGHQQHSARRLVSE